jgi:hypothetical protein
MDSIGGMDYSKRARCTGVGLRWPVATLRVIDELAPGFNGHPGGIS